MPENGSSLERWSICVGIGRLKNSLTTWPVKSTYPDVGDTWKPPGSTELRFVTCFAVSLGLVLVSPTVLLPSTDSLPCRVRYSTDPASIITGIA